MWLTNLKVLAVGLATILMYTLVAHIIPQLESDVPEELALTGEVTTEQLVSAGERLYQGAGGCAACHGLGTRAPNLLADHAGQGAIGARCGDRPRGLSCKAYLHESMIDPGAYVVPGFENIMPDVRRQLSDDQIWAVIAFLESQGGEVTVTSEDLPTRTEGFAAGTPAGATGPTLTATMDPRRLLAEKGCIACHVLEGAGGPIGPPFDGMGRRANAERIRRGILMPNADTARGYEQFAGTMPATFGQQLTADQLETIVEFLRTLR